MTMRWSWRALRYRASKHRCGKPRCKGPVAEGLDELVELAADQGGVALWTASWAGLSMPVRPSARTWSSTLRVLTPRT